MFKNSKNASGALFYVIYILVIIKIIELFFSFSGNYQYSDKQWYISGDEKTKMNVGIPQMWNFLDKIHTKQEVVVAVIDGGMDISNQAISDNIWINTGEIADNGKDDDENGYIDDVNGWNFADNNNVVDGFKHDKYGLNHATKIAGIICANPKRNDVSGLINGKWIKLLPVKIIRDSERDNDELASGNVQNLINAIDYAEEMGADICNISLNSYRDNQDLKRVIKSSKMLFVVSAGNGKGMKRNLDRNPSYPASYNFKNLITVANIKANERLHSGSNYGEKSVDVSAPGTDIYNIDAEKGYSYGTGTSYSTPIVTATAAAIYATNPNMNAEKCKKIICDTADVSKLLDNKVASGRILNCENAVGGKKK